MSAPKEVFDLLSTYVRCDQDGTAARIEVTDEFWRDVAAGKRQDLDAGVLVAAFPYTSDWTSSEMHPAGAEIVYALSGEIDLVLEEDAGDRVVPLRAGSGVIVQRGTWHTARVRVPGQALHITPGAGTQHRSVRPSR